MDVLELFPRHILEGDLEPSLLTPLQLHAEAVLKQPERNPDASGKLAGQLTQQRELSLQEPAVAELCGSVLLPGCERWIRHVIDKQPPQGRGPWTPGVINCEWWMSGSTANKPVITTPPTPTAAVFQAWCFCKYPLKSAESFDGQLCFHGPEEWHIQSFRTGMAHYVLPKPGRFYIFPAWQPHSVMPFRGDGARWSLAFNVMAIPQPAGNTSPRNLSLSSNRPRRQGF